MPSATIPIRASRGPLPLRIAQIAHVRHCRAHVAQSCVRDLHPERLVRVRAQDRHRRPGLDFADRWCDDIQDHGGQVGEGLTSILIDVHFINCFRDIELDQQLSPLFIPEPHELVDGR